MEILLGLLSGQPVSGYDLGQKIRASVGSFWRESYGQIYPNLKRLEAEGLATAKTVRQIGNPEKRIFSITGKGRERLAEWLALEPQPEIPRNEMLLKLFFGAQISPEISIQHLERWLKRERESLRELRRMESEELPKDPKNPGSSYRRMAARFSLLQQEAHQRWGEETLEILRKMAKKQRKREEKQREKGPAEK